MRSRGGGGVQRLASEQDERDAGKCWGSDMIRKVQLMGGAEEPRGVEFDMDPPFHLKLQFDVGKREVSVTRCCAGAAQLERRGRTTCTNLPMCCRSLQLRTLKRNCDSLAKTTRVLHG
jgi:hypothetical protein